MLLFKENLLSKRLHLGRKPTQTSWEKEWNNFVYLETNIILLTLEMAFPYFYPFIHTKGYRNPQTPTISSSTEEAKCVHKPHPVKRTYSCLLSQKKKNAGGGWGREGAGKEGIARRVKLKQSFAQNWRSSSIDWLLVRWRDWPRKSVRGVSVLLMLPTPVRTCSNL